jgi:tetratricopeptide (TPR) repeat protein
VGRTAPGGAPVASLRDPRTRARCARSLTAADLLFRRRQFTAALGPLEAVLAQERDNRFALYRASVALTELGRTARALPMLERLVQLDPLSPEAQAALADALSRAKRPADAVPHWLEATRLQPRRAEVWASASAPPWAWRAAEKDAADALAQAVRLEPRDPRFLIRLGFAEHGAGRPADAVRHLLAAAEVAGKDAFRTRPPWASCWRASAGRRKRAPGWPAPCRRKATSPRRGSSWPCWRRRPAHRRRPRRVVRRVERRPLAAVARCRRHATVTLLR